jgi:DNA-binding FadR family transcriptional regulator
MAKATRDVPAKASATHEIASFLSSRIRAGELAPGARLPTEQALARQFEVSRPVVREAISRVKANGLVRSRQGSGLYVADLLDRRSFTVGDDLVGDISGILRLFELRLPMEMSAARLAAARRTAIDLDRLDAAHARMVEADNWSDEGVVADLAFHHAIAVATQNTYYADFMAFVGGVLHDGMRVARSKSRWVDVRSITIDEHARILRAIRNQDPEPAALAILTHIESARDRMSAGHAALLDL